MYLEIHDNTIDGPQGTLAIAIGHRHGIDYMYQIEQWVIDTADDVDGSDLARWDCFLGTKDAPGRLIRQWARQPDGKVVEVKIDGVLWTHTHPCENNSQANTTTTIKLDGSN